MGRKISQGVGNLYGAHVRGSANLQEATAPVNLSVHGQTCDTEPTLDARLRQEDKTEGLQYHSDVRQGHVHVRDHDRSLDDAHTRKHAEGHTHTNGGAIRGNTSLQEAARECQAPGIQEQEHSSGVLVSHREGADLAALKDLSTSEETPADSVRKSRRRHRENTGSSPASKEQTTKQLNVALERPEYTSMGSPERLDTNSHASDYSDVSTNHHVAGNLADVWNIGTLSTPRVPVDSEDTIVTVCSLFALCMLIITCVKKGGVRFVI